MAEGEWEPLPRHTCPVCHKQVTQHHEPGVSLSCKTGPFGAGKE